MWLVAWAETQCDGLNALYWRYIPLIGSPEKPRLIVGLGHPMTTNDHGNHSYSEADSKHTGQMRNATNRERGLLKGTEETLGRMPSGRCREDRVQQHMGGSSFVSQLSYFPQHPRIRARLLEQRKRVRPSCLVTALTATPHERPSCRSWPVSFLCPMRYPVWQTHQMRAQSDHG